MRMWKVPPVVLCRKHLLGEHVEMHMFAGTIAKRISLQGYLDNGLVDLGHIKERHDALAKEMIRRGFNHKSPMPVEPGEREILTVDVEANLKELCRRCPECRKRIALYYREDGGFF